MLLSWHNIQYYQDLMAAMRVAISAGTFAEFDDFHAQQTAAVILTHWNWLMVEEASALRHWLNDAAMAAGFHSVHVTPPPCRKQPAQHGNFWPKAFHGDMGWLADTEMRRCQPVAMWPDAFTAIVLTMNYGPDHDTMYNICHHDRGNISVYARGRDYHNVIKGKLKQLASQFAARSKANVRVFVDTAPLMEKPLAAQAGAGWQGKHTNLVSRSAGSWLFLGIILTNSDLPWIHRT